MDIDLILSSLNLAWTKISPLVINLLSVLILLLIGYLVARALGMAVAYIARLIMLDKISEQSRLKEVLGKGDIKKPLSELLGDLIYWVMLFISIIGITEFFRLPIDPALEKVFSFIAIIFVAAIILGMGAFFASLIAGVVRLVAANFGIEGAKTISRVIYYIVIVFAFLATLSQLGIGTEVFIPQIGVIIGAFGLAAAIAFGLGCKDMAADFLYNLFKGK